jgi:hypothetical protein
MKSMISQVVEWASLISPANGRLIFMKFPPNLLLGVFNISFAGHSGGIANLINSPSVPQIFCIQSKTIARHSTTWYWQTQISNMTPSFVSSPIFLPLLSIFQGDCGFMILKTDLPL